MGRIFIDIPDICKKLSVRPAVILMLSMMHCPTVWAAQNESPLTSETRAEKPVSKCETATDPKSKCVWTVVKSVGPSATIYPVGLRLANNTKITLKRLDRLTLLSRNRTRVLKGPGTYDLTNRLAGASTRLSGLIADRVQIKARTGKVRDTSRNSPPPPVAEAAPSPASAGIPVYPVWPPETPSSRVGLDRFVQSRANTSLYGAGQKLKRAFEDAGYLEHSFYAVPGGFTLVTRIEKIKSNGDAFEGDERYRLPNQPRTSSLTGVIRDLFLDAPPGYYRYIAVVVSNKPFRTSGRRLSHTTAIQRLQSGSNNLSAKYKRTAFSADFKVEALIYEFRKNNKTGKTRMIAPGRLAANTHLAKTRLNKTVASRFRR